VKRTHTSVDPFKYASAEDLIGPSFDSLGPDSINRIGSPSEPRSALSPGDVRRELLSSPCMKGGSPIDPLGGLRLPRGFPRLVVPLRLIPADWTRERRIGAKVSRETFDLGTFMGSYGKFVFNIPLT